MKNRVVLTFTAALALAVGLIGCATARRSEPIVGRVVAGDPSLAAGRQLFMQNCHACHPGGEAGLGPALNNKPLPPCLIEFQVRHGLGAMPALKTDRLSEGDLDEVVKYLVALRRG